MADSHNSAIRQAAQSIANGGVLAYPTEAVWGLGCDPFNQAAVERILQLKGRSVSKGLILVAAQIEQFAPFLQGLSEAKLAMLKASWPGPNTWLVPNNGVAKPWVSGGQATLALRVTAHPLVQQLCMEFGGPITSTSANPQGLPAAKTEAEVLAYFKKGIDVILPGSLGGDKNPTCIRNLETGELVRPS